MHHDITCYIYFFMITTYKASRQSPRSSCIENVLRAAPGSVDLFVITTSQAAAATLRSLAEGLRTFAALRHVVVALGANKGRPGND